MSADTDLRDKAVDHLQRTTISYPRWSARPPRKTDHWYQAQQAIDQIGDPKGKEAWLWLTRTTANYKDWIHRVEQGLYDPPDGSTTNWGRAFAALDAIGVVGPPPGLGSLIADELPESPGAEVHVSSWAQLQAAFLTAPLGSRIHMNNDITGSGDLIWRRQGNDAQVTRLYGNGYKLNNVRVEIMGTYLCVEDLEVVGGNPDCFKTDYSTSSTLRGAHHITLKNCIARNAAHQGLLVSGESASAVHHIQILNFRAINCGSNDNKDHGIYWSKGSHDNYLINYLAEDNQAYGLQMYPDCVGLIASGITIRGGRVRGGIVIGSESAGPTHDNVVVGAEIYDSPRDAVQPYNAGPNNQFRSCTEYQNASGFGVGAGVTYTNAGHTAHWPIALGDLVYVATHDINGVPRVGEITTGAFA